MSVWKFPAWGICMFSVLNFTITAFNQVNCQFGGECFCYGTKTKFWSWLGRLPAAAWSALKNLPVTVFGQRSVFLAKDPAPHLRWARQWSNDSISHPLYLQLLTICLVRALIANGGWLLGIDLKASYFHPLALYFYFHPLALYFYFHPLTLYFYFHPLALYLQLRQ